VAGTIDLLPTFVALAGGTVPEQPVIDGRDMSGLIRGTSSVSPREAHYYFLGYALQAVRQGPWKLAVAPQSENKIKAKGKKKAVADAQDSAPRLYNLDQDIGEQTDLAAQHPDIVARLTALAQKMEAEIGGKAPSARRPAGHVEHPKPLYPMSEPGKGGKK